MRSNVGRYNDYRHIVLDGPIIASFRNNNVIGNSWILYIVLHGTTQSNVVVVVDLMIAFALLLQSLLNSPDEYCSS